MYTHGTNVPLPLFAYSLAHGPSTPLALLIGSSSFSSPPSDQVLVPQNSEKKEELDQDQPTTSCSQNEVSLLAENLMQLSEQKKAATERKKEQECKGLVKLLSQATSHPESEQSSSHTPIVAQGACGGRRVTDSSETISGMEASIQTMPCVRTLSHKGKAVQWTYK